MKAISWSRGLLAVLVAFVFAGCDDGHDDFDVDPAPGYGAMIVDNNSGSDFDVYGDGHYLGEVESGDHLSQEFTPGVVRVFLRQRGGDHRGYGDDLDILEGRRTILRIYRSQFAWDDFRVSVEYD